MFDSKTNRFFNEQDIVFEIEHSLASISKWESKYHTFFINNKDKTGEQMLDYIKMMTTTPNIPDSTYMKLTKENIEDIVAYMNDSMTATTFRKEEKTERNTEIITSEIIYYWMVELTIPFECQYWHINRLMTLIRVVSTKREEAEKKSKNKGKNKSMSHADAARRANLNAARRKQYGSKG